MILVFCFFVLSALPLWANGLIPQKLLERQRQTPRSSALSGLGTILGQENLIANPAQLAKKKFDLGFEWQGVLPHGIFTLVDDVVSLQENEQDQASAIQDLIEKNLGRSVHPSFAQGFLLHTPFISFDTVAFFGSDLVFHNFNGNLVNVIGLGEVEYKAGYGQAFFEDRLEVGLALGVRERFYLQLDGDLETIARLSDEETQQEEINEIFSAGRGMFVDTGFIFSPKVPWDFKVALHLQDFGGVRYRPAGLIAGQTDGTVSTPFPDPTKVHLGLSLRPQFGLFYVLPTLGLKQLNLPLPFEEIFRLGCAGGLGTKLLDLEMQLGYHMRAFNIGFFMRFWKFSGQYAFTHQTIKTPGSLKNQGHAVLINFII